MSTPNDNATLRRAAADLDAQIAQTEKRIKTATESREILTLQRKALDDSLSKLPKADAPKKPGK